MRRAFLYRHFCLSLHNAIQSSIKEDALQSGMSVNITLFLRLNYAAKIRYFFDRQKMLPVGV
jgi:hypothetical protein